jgi:hypothetical protein
MVGEKVMYNGVAFLESFGQVFERSVTRALECKDNS